MSLTGKKIAVLIESDYYEPEIAYYQHRFAEEDAELHLMSRLWGQPSLTFYGFTSTRLRSSVRRVLSTSATSNCMDSTP